jgi:hypothetical protein
MPTVPNLRDMRTNDYTLPQFQHAIDAFVAGGGERPIALAVLGVKPEYLEASLKEMQKEYGSIEKYFLQGLRDRLRGAAGAARAFSGQVTVRPPGSVTTATESGRIGAHPARSSRGTDAIRSPVRATGELGVTSGTAPQHTRG